MLGETLSQDIWKYVTRNLDRENELTGYGFFRKFFLGSSFRLSFQQGGLYIVDFGMIMLDTKLGVIQGYRIRSLVDS